MSDEIPAIRWYYRSHGQAVFLRSAESGAAINVVVGGQHFEHLRQRNPGATFEPEPPRTTTRETTGEMPRRLVHSDRRGRRPLAESPSHSPGVRG